MGKRAVKYCMVDAFTETPFKGNPAAVCLLEEERDEEWLQAVATEFNVSQTVYVIPLPNADSIDSDSDSTPRLRLRWFTPVAEVALCGHGTLAAAHFLFTTVLSHTDKIEFLTLSGILTTKRVFEASGNFSIEMDFPVVPLVEDDPSGEVKVLKAIKTTSVIEIKKTAADDFLVVLPSGKNVSEFEPQYDLIQSCPGRGVLITGPASTESGFDFISRFFCPKMGINEDPVCGSAHCVLASYWAKRIGKCDLLAYQASPRGGILNLHLDETNQRVLLRGKAVCVIEGSILV